MVAGIMNVYRPQWLNVRGLQLTASHWSSFVAASLLLWPCSSLGQNADHHSSGPTTPIDNVSLDVAPQTMELSAVPSGRKQQGARGRNKTYDIRKVGNRGIGDGINFYSPKREQELGRKLATKVEQSAPVVTDGEVNDYVVRLSQRIVHNSDAKVPLTIKVLLQDEVNAYSLPGGYLYVDAGLILRIDNEAQLAGVIAHEVAHIAARHSTREETKALLYASTSPLVVLAPLMRFKYSRNAEREADLLGLEYQYLAGYDPQEIIRFFEKMQDREGEPTFLGRALSSYPSASERIKRTQKNIQLYLPNKDQYVVDTAAFEQIKSKVRKLVDAARGPKSDSEAGVFPERHQ
jgi:predicted Zn-dependent protease